MNRTAQTHGPLKRVAFLLVLASLGAAPAAYAQKASTTDPRVGLKPGLTDAGEAAKNMTLISHSPRPAALSSTDLSGLTFANSDLAFKGNLRLPGQLQRLPIWDISNAEQARR